MASTPSNEKHEPFIFEMVEKTSNMNELVLKPVTSAEAFRKYNAIVGPAMNRSGNLRGMVINAKMKLVYKLAGDVGNKLDVISALIEITKEYSKLQKIYKSNSPGLDKASHISFLLSAAVLRSATSLAPAFVSYTILSVEGYAKLFSLVTGSQSGNTFAAKLDGHQKKIFEIHSQQWDGENWYKVTTGTVR
jgi:hypothetical protein